MGRSVYNDIQAGTYSKNRQLPQSQPDMCHTNRPSKYYIVLKPTKASYEPAPKTCGLKNPYHNHYHGNPQPAKIRFMTCKQTRPALQPLSSRMSPKTPQPLPKNDKFWPPNQQALAITSEEYRRRLKKPESSWGQKL